MRAQDHDSASTSRSQPRRAAAQAVGPAQAPLHPEAPLTQQAILQLQRTIGNAATARLIEAQRQQHGDSEPVQRSAVPDVLRSPGRPLDAGLRQEMQARLGADLSDVRLHTDTAAQRSAAEIGARAYTSGNHVVTGTPHVDKRTLAHELTHVLQQRQGPVAGTDRGDGLAVSDPADRFERAAEANASAVMSRPVPLQRADEAQATTTVHGTSPIQRDPGDRTDRAGGEITVQRAVGVELEDTNWTVHATEPGKELKKFTRLAGGAKFELQAEFAGDDRWCIEIVTTQGGVETEALEGVLKEINTFADKMVTAAQAAQPRPLRTQELARGASGYTIQHAKPAAPAFTPSLQITVGVPLEAVPTAFAKLSVVKVKVNSMAKDGADIARERVAAQFDDPSAKLIGFLTLVESYLRAGRGTERRTFPKGLFPVMARTDFASMFSLLDDHDKAAARADVGAWVTKVMRTAGLGDADADQPLLQQWYYDPQDEGRAFQINTTRRQWLTGIAQEGGQDLLRGNFSEGSDDQRLRERTSHVDVERIGRFAKLQQAWITLKGIVSGPRRRENEKEKRRLAAMARTRPEFKNIASTKFDDNTLRTFLNDAYQGLGGLGARTDAAPATAPDSPAVILELRDPGDTNAQAGLGGVLAKVRQINNIINAAIAQVTTATVVAEPEPTPEREA